MTFPADQWYTDDVVATIFDALATISPEDINPNLDDLYSDAIIINTTSGQRFIVKVYEDAIDAMDEPIVEINEAELWEMS